MSWEKTKPTLAKTSGGHGKLGKVYRMRSIYGTCMEMFGNGAAIGMVRTLPRPKMIREGPFNRARPGSAGAGAGTTPPGDSGRRSAPSGRSNNLGFRAG